MKARAEKLNRDNFQPENLHCSACGAESRRLSAKFCFTCGKLLNEGYQPLDTLRASYRMQGKSFLRENSVSVNDSADIFQREQNDMAQSAWACCVYSMVPYLGILFIPITLILGALGIAAAVRHPRLGGRQIAMVSVGLSFLILFLQVFLWALLYIIPELGKTV